MLTIPRLILDSEWLGRGENSSNRKQIFVKRTVRTTGNCDDNYIHGPYLFSQNDTVLCPTSTCTLMRNIQLVKNPDLLSPNDFYYKPNTMDIFFFNYLYLTVQ